ncbi:Sterile alpha motif domain [Arabidopsis thaliana x Arabidopsis arenosa]|uniref:Sterile alpha motif domain n=1 Tax=Arabidopsis thaliana x Arabidopsis arenosa TaxID=1240361 RepID=A0A8T1YYP3_9BRAS|nr:Sterile alpha motif domain [Arabidopsis thaliana x Arabidopsis arenosa]
MAELQLVEGHQINGGFIPPAIVNSIEAPETSAAAGVSVGSKRLRRPSVRLGDIGGDQYHQHVVAAYDSQVRRPKWRPSGGGAGNRKEPTNQSGKTTSSSRTRTMTNLSSGGYENTGTLDEDPISVGSWRVKKWVKSSGGETAATNTVSAKRVRSNWASRNDGDEKFSGGEEGEEEEEEEDELGEEGFRDFSREDSESPMKERRRYENREVELLGDWQSGGRGKEGVKIWLQELGLGRYWPMFEMHEVDEQVLPLLTLEDLKDMGINAVGSRRKMYCAIQKLGREFS